MNTQLAPLLSTLNLNTKLLLNVLEGVSDALAATRPNVHTNNIAFITCHLIDARHFLASITGRVTEKPFKEILESAKTVEDIDEYPAVDELKAAWEDISRILADHWVQLADELLAEKSPQAFPLEDKTILGGITFLLAHESYHIGQLGFLRRYFGLSPMKYT